MKIYLEFTSKNDGRGYYLTFESIEEYLKFSKPFINASAKVSIRPNSIRIMLTEPIYHTGDFNNYNSTKTKLKNK